MLEVTQVTSDNELVQIHSLNGANLKIVLSNEQQQQLGFVTWLYSISLLKQLHSTAPSIIVKNQEKVVGYALTALIKAGSFHTDLREMIMNLETINFKGKPLSSYNIILWARFVLIKIIAAKVYSVCCFKSIKSYIVKNMS